MSVVYKVKVRNKDNVEIGEFDSIQNLQFGKRLNNYGTCQFTIPANNLKALSLVSLRRNSVWIYRIEDGETRLVWSGEQFFRRGQLLSNLNNWVTVFCYSWFEQLNHKYTSAVLSYEQIDAGEIAWDMIDGAYGITRGVIQPTQLRNREYNNQNVMEAIINLSNVIGGSDFEINDSKVFNWKPMGADRSNEVVFEYGDNITDIVIDEDFSIPANRAIILGQNADTGELVRYDQDDLESQALIGLRELVDTESDVSETLTFQQKAQSLLRKYKLPLVKIQSTHLPSVHPSIVDFSLGDIARLIVNYGIYAIDEKYRIFEWTTTYNADNTEQLSVVLGKFTL